jgi:hypothetical protein
VRSQRIIFTAYLVVILVGLGYFALLGATHR